MIFDVTFLRGELKTKGGGGIEVMFFVITKSYSTMKTIFGISSITNLKFSPRKGDPFL